MTKMDMVWIAVATLIRPETASSVAVSKDDIDQRVYALFQTHITPVMITMHLVNSIDRQADTHNPRRGGSRNRYLAMNADGRYRLYKKSDQHTDAADKTGPIHPLVANIDREFEELVCWYLTFYYDSDR